MKRNIILESHVEAHWVNVMIQEGNLLLPMQLMLTKDFITSLCLAQDKNEKHRQQLITKPIDIITVLKVQAKSKLQFFSFIIIIIFIGIQYSLYNEILS